HSRADLRLQVILKADVDTGLGLFHCDAGLPPPNHLEPHRLLYGLLFGGKIVAAGDNLRLHRERHPNVRREADCQAEKVRRHHANDVVGSVADANLAAEDRGTASQSALPETVADDGDGIRVARFVDSRVEGVPQTRIHAENWKIRTTDH